MKRQYLGDSKDCFKWDYHDHLMSAHGCKILTILLMMTPDDKSNDGKTKPDLFPARTEKCRQHKKPAQFLAVNRVLLLLVLS